MFETLEATPVSVGANEIYLALSRGQIDGQDNGYDVSIPYKWHEVAPYWSATDHVFELGVWYASERTWQSLPAEDREMIRAAADEGGALVGSLTEEIDRTGKDILTAAGVTVVDPDMDAFRTKLADVHKSFEGTVWPDGLVAKIRALQS
jgi:TRAP-type C4-dicarboxylate transport system substrate-binding protein